MKEFTRRLKNESYRDFHNMQKFANTTAKKMTPQQIEQHTVDKKNHYETKWHNLLSKCETLAQRQYCLVILNNLDKVR